MDIHTCYHCNMEFKCNGKINASLCSCLCQSMINDKLEYFCSHLCEADVFNYTQFDNTDFGFNDLDVNSSNSEEEDLKVKKYHECVKCGYKFECFEINNKCMCETVKYINGRKIYYCNYSCFTYESDLI